MREHYAKKERRLTNRFRESESIKACWSVYVLGQEKEYLSIYKPEKVQPE